MHLNLHLLCTKKPSLVRDSGPSCVVNDLGGSGLAACEIMLGFRSRLQNYYSNPGCLREHPVLQYLPIANCFGLKGVRSGAIGLVPKRIPNIWPLDCLSADRGCSCCAHSRDPKLQPRQTSVGSPGLH